MASEAGGKPSTCKGLGLVSMYVSKTSIMHMRLVHILTYFSPTSQKINEKIKKERHSPIFF